MIESEHKPLCILLPGMDGTGHFFAGFARALAPFADVCILTYPQDQALDYAVLCQHLLPRLPSDRTYILIAESFAGPLAILLAEAAEHKPGALILAATFMTSPVPASLTIPLLPLTARLPVPQWLLRTLLLGPGTAHLAPQINQVIQSLDRRILTHRIRSVLTCNVSSALAKLDMPILYLRARHDLLVSGRSGTKMAEVNGNIVIAEVDSAHFVLQDAPDRLVADIVVPFLRDKLSPRHR